MADIKPMTDEEADAWWEVFSCDHDKRIYDWQPWHTRRTLLRIRTDKEELQRLRDRVAELEKPAEQVESTSDQ